MRKLYLILLGFIFCCTCSFAQGNPDKKIPATNIPATSINPTMGQLNNYIGIYQLVTDKQRTITVSKEDDHLVGEISGQTTLPLHFVSKTKFVFEGVKDAACEFITEKGKVRRIVVFQNGKYIWKKIK